MTKRFIIVIILFISILLFACINQHKKPIEKQAVVEYIKDIDTLNNQVNKLLALVEAKATWQQLQDQFLIARAAYKKTEWFAEYYNPYTAKSINGPAIPEVEADEKTKVVPPEGFQVIEELLFPVYEIIDQPELSKQIKILQSNTGRLKYVASTLETTNAHIFDALRLQLFRIIALGIAGFDSPVAKNSISEAKSSLQSIYKYYSLYAEQIKNKNKPLADSIEISFKQCESSLSKQTDFNLFDRMSFIKQYLNPLSENLLIAQKELNIPVFTEPRFLKADAPTMFSKNIFNPDFYTPGTNAYSNEDKVNLGKKLFYDGILSSNGKRSCGSCHQREKAFTDGLKTSLAITGKNLRRNSPTLINAALQPSLFYDMRVNLLEDQAKDVISNKDEMHGSFEKALIYANKDKSYLTLFTKIYPGKPITEFHIKNAIASYIRSLVDLNSRFDKFMQGDEAAINEMEIKGFNLFMGKAKCGTCHFTPLFNGNNPPGFLKTDAEVIGVPATTDTIHPVLDSDEGKYNLYKIDIHKGAFKTPTLRNVALTAPYMHNGAFTTLEEVVDFYNRGGASGLGLKVNNQTLPEEPLNLSLKEKKALISFLKTLTGTVKSHEKISAEES